MPEVTGSLPSPRRARLRWSRLDGPIGGGVLIGLLVLAIAVSPGTEPFVDWVMDGDVTPDVWEPIHWLAGAVVTLAAASVYGAPLALITLVVVSIACVRSDRGRRGVCPTCGSMSGAETGDCVSCGLIPPRGPARFSVEGLRAACAALALSALAVSAAIVLATCINWVSLEREEDAFGERARAAAASGAASYQELSANGSVLGWRAEGGYWSHRD